MTLFVLPAASIYEVQGRVTGWRHTPASRDALKALKALAPRLTELGVTKVVASDLDEQSAKALSNKLGVPCELWYSLRRWNWGKHHGAKADKAMALLTKLDRPEVPIQGGDSRASFDSRMAASRERLAKADRVLVVAAPREIAAILQFPSVPKLEHARVYEVP
jgi:broad specificity phosphatase PhoE